MSKFATIIVDDVIASVHRAVQQDVKANTQSRIKRRSSHDGQTALSKGITEQYFEENRAKLKDFLTHELHNLLNAKCDVKFLERYIKHSRRSYIKIYEKHGAQQRIGDAQLANFFEAKINYVLHKEENLTLKMEVISYLRGTELIDEEKDNKNKEEIEKEGKEELKNYLMSRKVNEFWIKLEKQKAEQAEKEANQDDVNEAVIMKLPTEEDVSAKHFSRGTTEWHHYEWENDPLHSHSIIKQINNLSEFYIKNRYEKLKKLEASLLGVCKLQSKEELNDKLDTAIIDTKNNAKLPQTFECEVTQADKNNQSLIDEMKTVATQYNKMQELRSILHKTDQVAPARISSFKEAYEKKDNQDILNKHIDGPLKKLLFAISNLITRQFFSRGTFRFWRTDPELIGEVITGFKSPQKVVKEIKLESNHLKASRKGGG